MPIDAIATTANRLTPHPWERSNEANDDTSDESAFGWEIWDIWLTMATRLPDPLPIEPCQNPRPGHAWSTANPRSNPPVAPRTQRPSLGPDQAESDSATSTPATT